MDKFIIVAKSALSGVVAFIISKLGGYDSALELLLVLMTVDIILGTCYAFITKKLSSSEMRKGLIRKVSVFLLIFIATELDLTLFSFVDSDYSGVGLNARSFTIIWFCLDEVISLLEHCANLGVPLPDWLRDILVQVENSVSSNIPRKLIDIINKLLNLNIKLDSDESSTDDDHDTDV